jgi:hypothetical protein
MPVSRLDKDIPPPAAADVEALLIAAADALMRSQADYVMACELVKLAEEALHRAEKTVLRTYHDRDEEQQLPDLRVVLVDNP